MTERHLPPRDPQLDEVVPSHPIGTNGPVGSGEPGGR